MYSIETLPGRTIELAGGSYLYFSGTAYLGLVQHPAFKDLVAEGVSRYGVHYGGSRLAAVRLRLFEAAEARLARLSGAEAGLVLSSGTLAGQMALRVAHQPGAVYSFAPDVHPALWPEGYRPASGSFDTWVRSLCREAPQGPPLVLLTNSLDPLRARRYDFNWLLELPRERAVTLVIDDSHGFGLCGPNGGGIRPQLPACPHIEVVVISSLGKAFGIPGGAILASADFIRRIWESPFFGGASPGPPAFLHAFLNGQPLYRAARKQLRRNVDTLRRLLPASHPLQGFDNYPVLFCPDPQLAPYLYRHRVLISHFSYPTPQDEAIARLVLNSLHTLRDVERLARLIKKWLKEKRRGEK